MRSTDLATSPKSYTPRSPKERVLVEFPAQLIERADVEAARTRSSRSKLIRDAVEGFLTAREKARVEAELAEAYIANAGRNLEMLEEFSAVDGEIVQ